MIEIFENDILIQTKKTSLLLSHDLNQKLLCSYYGRKIRYREEIPYLKRNYSVLQGGSLVVKDSDAFSNNDLKLALSTKGIGDYFSPSLLLSPFDTLDFVFIEAKKSSSLPSYPFPLPKGCQDEVVILLKEKVHDIFIEIHYLCFEEEDVIGCYTVIQNRGEKEFDVQKVSSFQLSLVNRNDTIVSTYGSWANELNVSSRKLSFDRTVIESSTGTSSSRHNPFVYLKEADCTLFSGCCYGFNLLYSGDFETSFEMDAFSNVRIQSGFSSTGFLKRLNPGESFRTPCGVFSFSFEGENSLGRNFQRFVNQHIIPEHFRNREREIVYNSWEALGMKFDKGKLFSLMKKASLLGMELFVLDDGWFSTRSDDSHGLGDWNCNLKKIPGGLKSLSDQAKKLGMKFGIWMEPEMINEDTMTFRKNPDWIIQDIHGSLRGRHQYLLDLSKKEVQDFVKESVSEVLRSADISYLKWDFNRNFSNSYSPSLNYDYVLGLYKVLKELVERFPDVVFENCSSGGNRFDLGMLSFFSQSWMSDNTDSFKREQIQTGAMFGYPLSVMSNHVSCKTSNQLLRKTSYDTKFEVAMYGVLGYEFDLDDLSKAEEISIREQIAFYKKYRKVLQFGDFYKLQESSRYSDLILQASLSDTHIVSYFRAIDDISFPEERLMCKYLIPDALYSYRERRKHIPLSQFGMLVNYISPVHLKEDGLLYSLIGKYKDMLSEEDCGISTGAVLSFQGPILSQEWSGAGYNEHIRFMGDFSSRCYVIEKTAAENLTVVS